MFEKIAFDAVFPVQSAWEVKTPIETPVLGHALNFLTRTIALSVLTAPNAVVAVNTLKVVTNITKIDTSRLSGGVEWTFTLVPTLLNALSQFFDSGPSWLRSANHVVELIPGASEHGFHTILGFSADLYYIVNRQITTLSHTQYGPIQSFNNMTGNHEFSSILIPLGSILILRFALKWVANQFGGGGGGGGVVMG